MQRHKLKTFLLGFLFIPTLLGCDTRPVPAEVSAEFPITTYPDLIYVPVTIDASEHQCVLDSGSAAYVFHTTLRQKLGSSVGDTPIALIDGSIGHAAKFRLPDVHIGAITLDKKALTLCYDLSSIREAIGCDIEGIIGLSLFQSHIVQLDFDTHRLVICSPSTRPESAWGEPLKLSYTPDKLPTVLVDFGDGTSEQCIVDTGFAGSVWLPSKLYAKLLNKNQVFAIDTTPFATLSGIQTVPEGSAPYMKIGSIRDHDVVVRGGGGKSRIGLYYLRKFRVTIDIPHDRMYLAKGMEFDKPRKQRAVGIGLLRKKAKTVVTWIEPDSPAEDVGISVNDELVTIAGEPIVGRSLAEIYWMLREKADPNGKLKLAFRRANKEREVELMIRDPSSDHPLSKEQAAATAEIRRLGGKVTFDEESPGKPLYAVDFSDTRIGDDALKTVEGHTDLKALILAHTRVTNAGLKHIEGLTQLRSLLLEDTRVTDAGLEHIKTLAHLEFLDLSNTQVTDAGLKQIGGLTKLHSLSLDDTRITDEGLKHLTVLTHLERLYTIRTKVTSAGWKELKQALPNVRGMGDDFDDIPR